MTDILSLIADLERAEQPSRDLDRRIALMVGWQYQAMVNKADGVVEMDHWRAPGEEKWQISGPPLYTSSLDAALPDEQIVQVKRLTIGHPDGDHWEAIHYPGGAEGYGVCRGVGRTEVMARRIACLRARL